MMANEKKNKKGEMKGGVKIFILFFSILIIFLIIIFIFSTSNNSKKFSENSLKVMKFCNDSCISGNQYNYCSVAQELRTKNVLGKQISETGTCDNFVKNGKLKGEGLVSCPSIDCSPQVSNKNNNEAQTTCVALAGKWESPNLKGNCKQNGLKIIRKINPSNSPKIKGEICCR